MKGDVGGYSCVTDVSKVFIKDLNTHLRKEIQEQIQRDQWRKNKKKKYWKTKIT